MKRPERDWSKRGKRYLIITAFAEGPNKLRGFILVSLSEKIGGEAVENSGEFCAGTINVNIMLPLQQHDSAGMKNEVYHASKKINIVFSSLSDSSWPQHGGQEQS